MKRFYWIAVCLVFALAALFSVAAFGKHDKAASDQKSEVVNAKDDASSPLSGKVVETMDAGGYTYVCIEKKGLKTWVAVEKTAVSVGQMIAFRPGVEMKNFTSKTLNRTFESIYFSGGVLAGAESGAIKAHSAAQGAPTGAAGGKISVKKAAGKNAYTIAEVYEKSAALHEKTAVIKGKVVKVSQGIMGKNWIHLQDGTGDAAKGTNDLVATSQDNPAVGDVITVKGTVYKDKDFGAGYRYRVIMEQASIQH